MTGQRLSEVQQFGLEILMMLDERARDAEETERMRLALLTADPALARGLYPGYFDEPGEEVQDDGTVNLNQEDTAYDFRQVEWESPTDMPDDDFEAVKRLLGSKGITVGTPMEAQEGLEDAPGLMEPDEPEWM